MTGVEKGLDPARVEHVTPVVFGVRCLSGGLSRAGVPARRGDPLERRRTSRRGERTQPVWAPGPPATRPVSPTPSESRAPGGLGRIR